MKILVFTVTAWNSKVGANTWESLLGQYSNNDIASICIRDEVPDSEVCSRYFTISENRIIKSILNRKIATGKEVLAMSPGESDVSQELLVHNERYRKMKKHRRYSMLMARELIWWLGKWRTAELDDFLDSFKPDVILHSMEGYIHLNRIISYCIKRTGATAVGYIWDDNFTYKQSKKTGYKIYRFFQRKSLKKLAKDTKAFFAISSMTKKEADDFFGIDCKILTKPLGRVSVVNYNEICKPIRILYTGNLLIGRDKSLLRVVKAIKERFSEDFILDVYTQTTLEEKRIKEIECGGICRIHSSIPQSEVWEKQKEADVLIFLEDIDGQDAHTARLSFSTKITDYLSSGKCIFAVGCADTAPIQYFLETDAAAVAVSDAEIYERLSEMAKNPAILIDYAERSREAGIKNHSEEKVLNTFNETIRAVLDLDT